MRLIHIPRDRADSMFSRFAQQGEFVSASVDQYRASALVVVDDTPIAYIEEE